MSGMGYVPRRCPPATKDEPPPSKSSLTPSSNSLLSNESRRKGRTARASSRPLFRQSGACEPEVNERPTVLYLRHDAVGERRRRCARSGLLERKSPRVPPRGGGALGRDGPPPAGSRQCLGGVGERVFDRPARTGAWRARSSLPSHEPYAAAGAPYRRRSLALLPEAVSKLPLIPLLIRARR
jgi:hypothetical protein